MRFIIFIACIIFNTFSLVAQTPADYLPGEFHKERRKILRQKMPENSVAVVFANPVRNRANDVNYVFHQNPDFYYLTGFRDSNAVLLLFSDNQTDAEKNVYNEVIYVPKRDFQYEMWNGKRLGVKGVKEQLGFTKVKISEEFISDTINFSKFDYVFIEKFQDDYRNSLKEKGEIYDLVKSFKKKANYNSADFLSEPEKKGYELITSAQAENFANIARIIEKIVTHYPELKDNEIVNGYKNAMNNKKRKEFQQKASDKLKITTNIDYTFLKAGMAEMREIKTAEELKLLTKAVRISAIGQIEVMKAVNPDMSEAEIQGIHEFVYKKYGAEHEGYPSIVGAGNNGCILHYIENNKTKAGNNLILMDLGAEYRGYTADVTRTIPANGKFTSEQKAIYNLVLKAQSEGIKMCTIGNDFLKPEETAREIINNGLANLRIITNSNEKHSYFPHGASHHIGLDVHDPATYGTLKENMIITVEPGIYIPDRSPCDKKWWGIAVRIEDDILITNNGPENLSEEAPRTIEDIEKMMAKKSVLDKFVLQNLDE